MRVCKQIMIPGDLQKVQEVFYGKGYSMAHNMPVVNDFSALEIAQTIFHLKHERYQKCLEALEVFFGIKKVVDNRQFLLNKIERSVEILNFFDSKGFKTFDSFKNVVLYYYPDTKESLLDAFWNGEYFLEVIIEICHDVYNKIKS